MLRGRALRARGRRAHDDDVRRPRVPRCLHRCTGLARMDAKYFGANRQKLLARLAKEFPSTFLVAENRGRLRGFIVGNPSGASCEIGPWVVEPGSRRVATDLYRALIDSAGASQV